MARLHIGDILDHGGSRVIVYGKRFHPITNKIELQIADVGPDTRMMYDCTQCITDTFASPIDRNISQAAAIHALIASNYHKKSRRAKRPRIKSLWEKLSVRSMNRSRRILRSVNQSADTPPPAPPA